MEENSVEDCARTARVKYHRALAERAFASHVIAESEESANCQRWLCESPKGSEYWFAVTAAPGLLVVNGDVGTLVLERPNTNMIGWARGAISSIDYFASKAPQELTVCEYDPKVAKEWLNDFFREVDAGNYDIELAEGDQEAMLDITDEVNTSGEFFMRVRGVNDDIFPDSDYPDLENFTTSFLWCRECLLWFFKAKFGE